MRFSEHEVQQWLHDSGDRNPIHRSLAHAKKCGYPAIVVPGMLAAMMLKRRLLLLPGASDLGVQVRFSGPVYVEREYEMRPYGDGVGLWEIQASTPAVSAFVSDGEWPQLASLPLASNEWILSSPGKGDLVNWEAQIFGCLLKTLSDIPVAGQPLNRWFEDGRVVQTASVVRGNVAACMPASVIECDATTVNAGEWHMMTMNARAMANESWLEMRVSMMVKP
ncbi:MAG: MaoC family dehydratase [Shewanella sp.]|nr:MaoC family dehydratase [Shewanella sp.]NRB22281.1 MaoC family dehydratase [Shewanella sp.]